MTELTSFPIASGYGGSLPSHASNLEKRPLFVEGHARFLGMRAATFEMRIGILRARTATFDP